MNDERDRAREGLPPPTAPYLPVQTGRVHVRSEDEYTLRWSRAAGRTCSRRITSMPSSRLPREWLRRFG